MILADFFIQHDVPGKNCKWKAVVKTGVLAGLWILWIRRNKCIFEGAAWSHDELQEAFNFNLALWLHCSCKEFKFHSLADLQRDWLSAI